MVVKFRADKAPFSMKTISQIFETVKGLSFTEVVRYFHGEPGRGNKILCPFHADQAASFHVYKDGGHCFGCGWNGDSVDFVAGLRGASKVNAARIIGQAFGLSVDKILTREQRRELDRIAKEREQEKRFRTWEQSFFRDLAELKSFLEYNIEKYGPEIPAHLVKIIQKLDLIKHWLEILIGKNHLAKMEIYRDYRKGGEITRWTQRLKNTKKC